MASKEETSIIDKKLAISDEFNKYLFRLVKLIEMKFSGSYSDSSLIDRYKRRISVAKSTDPLIIIEKCKNKLWEIREHILNENDKFFIDSEYNEMVSNLSEKDEITHIIQLFKQKYSTLLDDEKTAIWGCLKPMLRCSIQYKIIKNEHS